MNNSNTNIDGQYTLVDPAIRTWSGQRAIKRESDLAGTTGLPTKAVMVDGSKILVDSKVLAPPASLRKKFYRELSAVGIRFGSVCLVPNARFDEVLAKAAEIQVEFDEATADIVANLARHYQDQEEVAEQLQPGITPFLRAGRWSKQEVTAAYGWNVIYRSHAEPAEDAHDEIKASYKEANEQIVPALHEDIAQEAATILKSKAISGEGKFTRRTLRPLFALREKVEGFAFIHPEVEGLVQAIDSVTDRMPATGNLGTAEVLMVRSLLRALTDPASLLEGGILTMPADAPTDDLLAGFDQMPAVEAESPDQDSESTTDDDETEGDIEAPPPTSDHENHEVFVL